MKIIQVQQNRRTKRLCSVHGCGKIHSAKGFCGIHYARITRYGTVKLKGRKGQNNPKWKGGITHDSSGRVMVLRPNHPMANGWGYVYRYRIIMERKLKRFLKPSELIHHLNGNRTDDRIENLLVTTASDHQKMHEHKRDCIGRFTYHENCHI